MIVSESRTRCMVRHPARRVDLYCPGHRVCATPKGYVREILSLLPPIE